MLMVLEMPYYYLLSEKANFNGKLEAKVKVKWG